MNEQYSKETCAVLLCVNLFAAFLCLAILVSTDSLVLVMFESILFGLNVGFVVYWTVELLK